MKNKPKVLHPFKKGVFLTRHHIVNRSKHGTSVPSNILKIWSDRHVAFHEIFSSHTINRIIDNFYLFRFYRKRPQWKLLFGDKTDDEIIKVLKRLSRMKKSIKHREA